MSNIEFKEASCDETGIPIWEAVVTYEQEGPICLGQLTNKFLLNDAKWIFIPYDDVWFDSADLHVILTKLNELNG